MEWTRSDTVALAQEDCVYCSGLGLLERTEGGRPCACVLRAIFRQCHNRFRACVEKEKSLSRVTLDFASRSRRAMWGRKDEEYIADFLIIVRRTLTGDEHRLFRYHYLLGADWRLCCRKLKMEKGRYFHTLYRVQQKLGRTFRELEPYGLFPLDQYFGSTVRTGVVALTPPPVTGQRLSDLVPLNKAA